MSANDEQPFPLFSHWSNSTTILSSSPTYSFTVTSDLVLTANFIHTTPDNNACPGLKNPTSFTSGSTSGSFIGFYSGQTGNKPYRNPITPNAMTGETGVNMTSDIIPANQLANITGNGGAHRRAGRKHW